MDIEISKGSGLIAISDEIEENMIKVSWLYVFSYLIIITTTPIIIILIYNTYITIKAHRAFQNIL